MGSVAAALATAMALIAFCWSGLHGAQAQGTYPVTCDPTLTGAGDGAPFNDANEMVQYLRSDTTSEFCPPDPCNGFYWGQWNAMVTVCIPQGTCFHFNTAGNYLNEVLAECNQQNNEVLGLYATDPYFAFYLTSSSCVPNCFDFNVEYIELAPPSVVGLPPSVVGLPPSVVGLPPSVPGS